MEKQSIHPLINKERWYHSGKLRWASARGCCWGRVPAGAARCEQSGCWLRVGKLSPLGAVGVSVGSRACWVGVSVGSRSRECWVGAWVRPELGWMPGGEGEQQRRARAGSAARSPRTSLGLSSLPAAAASHSSPLPAVSDSPQSSSARSLRSPGLQIILSQKTHWGWWDRDATGCVRDAAPLGRVREAGHPNLEVVSAGRPRVPREELMPQRWAKARRGPGAWRGLGRLRKRKPSPARGVEAEGPQ